ncbi:MAG: DEAD/DEAH box helicase family protein, partial [Candidatus Korarchaeota archaeon]|nr:DEAD/DEAH box helicase family protein [Candidatus Korarchaeota archaeon]
MKIRIKDRVFVRSLDDREFSEILGQIREICRFDPDKKEWVLDPRLALARGWEVLRRIQVPKEAVEEAVAEVRRSVDAELEKMAREGTVAIFSPGRDRPPEPLERRGDYLVLEGSRLAELMRGSGVEGVLEFLRSGVRGYWREDLVRLAASTAIGPGRIALSDHAEGLLVEAKGLTQDQLARLDDMFTIEVNVQTRSGLQARSARLARRVGRARYIVPPFMFHHLRRFAAREGLEFVENVTWPSQPINVPGRDYQLYPFQEEAVDRWEEAERFGTVVIPTGGGKTYVGMEAIARTRLRTLVCVVTVELATQWRELIESKLGVRAG